ncbi:MAG: type II toxin-antitoxin system RelE/ParE family toxin [Candidatus Hydrothermarchaeota archaeon]|nr:type II toxin-antitoxin system RelE/ParE family toxin [Candidatus Hydrothermarchaeota archaeon]
MSNGYIVKAHPKFLDDLKNLDKDILKRVYGAIEKLKENPLRFKRLRGTKFYRLRIGKYRLIYSVSGGEVRLLIFGRRSEVYGEMKKRI